MSSYSSPGKEIIVEIEKIMFNVNLVRMLMNQLKN